jgi:hypothetical protein
MKRHQKALGIMEGARNVNAIARSLMEAVEEATGEGIGPEHDAAVRMMVHRLARLCKVEEIDYGFDPATLKDHFCLLVNECKSRAQEGGVIEIEPDTILLNSASLAELPESGQG